MKEFLLTWASPNGRRSCKMKVIEESDLTGYTDKEDETVIRGLRPGQEFTDKEGDFWTRLK